MDNLSDFLVKAPKQVLTHLKTLSAEKCLIAVNFGEKSSFLTAILDIDEKKQIITIDCGPKEYLNKELLNTAVINFKTDLKGIKVLFEGRGIKKVGKSGKPALSIKIPAHIYWIQRRQFYRVRSPLSKDSYCSISFPETGENQENEETLDYKLYDLSATGFSMLSESEELAEQLTVDTKYDDCKLVLDSAESHTISFIVRSKLALNPNRPHKGQRIGCEVLNIAPKIESAFLRYMHDIEREIKINQK